MVSRPTTVAMAIAVRNSAARRHAELVGKQRGETRQAAPAERDEAHANCEQEHAPLHVGSDERHRAEGGRRRHPVELRSCFRGLSAIVRKLPRDHGHEEVEHRQLHAEREPPVAIDPESKGGRRADRE